MKKFFVTIMSLFMVLGCISCNSNDSVSAKEKPALTQEQKMATAEIYRDVAWKSMYFRQMRYEYKDAIEAILAEPGFTDVEKEIYKEVLPTAYKFSLTNCGKFQRQLSEQIRNEFAQLWYNKYLETH